MDLVQIIVSQTTYTHGEAEKLLKENDGDYMKVLTQFMSPNKENNVEKKKRPYHQMKIDIIRETLDKANLNYREKKEKEGNIESI